MLGLLTGVILVVGGLLKAGSLVRFTPTAVLTGFLTAVGVNIVIGQLGHLTGFGSSGANRITAMVNTLANIGAWSPTAVATGAITIVLIALTHGSRFAGIGLVVAIVVGSLVAALGNVWATRPAELVKEIVDVPNGLPWPVMPAWGDIGFLILPALSLAFVCMIQGAGVAAGLPAPVGHVANPSRDVLGQGVGNLLSAVFRGMPVGGSLSASILAVESGAKTRRSLFVAGPAMALTVLFAAPLVELTAMPALAGLLIMLGVVSISPARITSVVRTGPFQTAVMVITFLLTLLIPLQFAVLVGIGLGIILFVAEQSNRLVLRRLQLHSGRALRETEPPTHIGPHEVVVLQPYGSLFFASAPKLAEQLPAVDEQSTGSVVIIRLRGVTDLDLAALGTIRHYAEDLQRRGSTLKLIAPDQAIAKLIESVGLADALGAEHLYRGDEWVGRQLRRAYREAQAMLDAD